MLRYKTSSSSLILLALFTSAALPADELVWQEFTSPPGGFSVLFPGLPMEQEQSLKSAAGTVTNRLYLTQVNNGDLVCLVSFADYPEATVKQTGADKLLESAQQGTLESLRGKLVTEQKLTLEKTHPGREFQLELGGAAHYRARLYLVNQRLYQIILVAKSKDGIVSKDAVRYFESFKLSQK